MSRIIDATIFAFISVVSTAAGAIEYTMAAQDAGSLEWLSRLVPEIAVLIVAGIGARWIIKLFIDQLNTLQDREDQRVERLLSIWEQNWKDFKDQAQTTDIEAGRFRAEMYSNLSDGHDKITETLSGIAEVLQRIARKLDAD